MVGWAAAVALIGSAAATAFGASLALDADSSELAPMQARLVQPDEDSDDDPRAKHAKASASATNANGKHLAKSIVERNPFCPTCQPVEAQPAQPAGPVLSDLPLDLIATIESSDPAYSMATIHDTETDLLGPFEIGEAVRPGVVLHSVERGRVMLRSGRALSVLELPDPEDRRKRKRKPKIKKKKSTRKNPRAIPGAEDAIECKKNHCTVQREFVDELIAKPSLLSKQARIVPAIRDGETQGFKFYGIRRGSLPRLLGLKNGDLLMAVNGTDLDSMDRAMNLYTKLRRANHLSVRIKRKGKVVTKEIQID
jgi:general secretion pathway protein C